MKISEYINEGNLEQYCLDMFNADHTEKITALSAKHPEIKKELNEIERALEQLAQSQAIAPRSFMKNRILTALNLAENKPLDINNLPVIDKYADYNSWLTAVEHLIPSEPFEDFFMQVLQQDAHISQTLVITKIDVPAETHEEVAESFFILKGQCVCTIGKNTYTLNTGDYLDIPLHENHDVKITSPYVIGIVQHQFV